MVGFLVFLVLLLAFFAILGRSSMPRIERVPLLSWGFRDLAANLVLGVRVFIVMSRRYAERAERDCDKMM